MGANPEVLYLETFLVYFITDPQVKEDPQGNESPSKNINFNNMLKNYLNLNWYNFNLKLSNLRLFYNIGNKMGNSVFEIKDFPL